MINKTLYFREMKKSISLLLIFSIILTMYITIIIGMYDPKMMESLNIFYDMMPELMAAVGMVMGKNTLIGFMISYLYGFIMLIFPMVYSILKGNGLISKYVESGAMVTLMAAPVKKKNIAITQAAVMMSGVILLILYATGVEIVVAKLSFPDEAVISEILKINFGLLCLQGFISGICFLSSCVFSETKYSIGFGAGIPALMYIMQMLSNVSDKSDWAKYFTCFTLYDPDKILASETGAIVGLAALAAGAVIFYVAGIIFFKKKDLFI